MPDRNSANSATLKVYENGVALYVSGNPSEIGGTFKGWIDETPALLPKLSTPEKTLSFYMSFQEGFDERY